jgi:hypothetical protein
VVENITRAWARRPDTLLVCTIGAKDNQTQLNNVQTISRLMTDYHPTLPPRTNWYVSSLLCCKCPYASVII